MHVSLKELMDKLGVGHILNAYETAPWSHYEDAKGITCSAEVRMGPDSDEVEAEAQFVYDDPPEGKDLMEQVFYLKAEPSAGGNWMFKQILVQSKPPEDDVPEMEDKACNLFRAIVQELIGRKIPDMEELVEREMHKRGGGMKGGGGGGGGGRKFKSKMGMGKSGF